MLRFFRWWPNEVRPEKKELLARRDRRREDAAPTLQEGKAGAAAEEGGSGEKVVSKVECRRNERLLSVTFQTSFLGNFDFLGN